MRKKIIKSMVSLYLCSYVPVIALLTSEALQVVNVGPCAHHHLESWNYFAARCAVTGISEESIKKKRHDLTLLFF